MVDRQVDASTSAGGDRPSAEFGSRKARRYPRAPCRRSPASRTAAGCAAPDRRRPAGSHPRMPGRAAPAGRPLASWRPGGHGFPARASRPEIGERHRVHDERVRRTPIKATASPPPTAPATWPCQEGRLNTAEPSDVFPPARMSGVMGRPRRLERRREHRRREQQRHQRPERHARYRQDADQHHPDRVADDHDRAPRPAISHVGEEQAADDPRQVPGRVGQPRREAATSSGRKRAG